MSSLLTPSKARTHMVNFRLTEEERASLARAAAAAGERSVSDFVRKTMLAEASQVNALEQRLERVEQQLAAGATGGGGGSRG